jgi:release factor glutamine methyltransferase
LALNREAGRYALPVTVLEVIQRSTEFLARKGVDSSRLQAELLLAHVLKLPRMQLYLNFERVLTSSDQDNMRELVKRRGEREPLQQIVGSTCFCGLEIAVNRCVLIPRPETELLAEQGWIFLNERAKRKAESQNAAIACAGDSHETTALDFGAGSGCVGIALAVNCKRARITALDVSAEALQTAHENAGQHGVLNRVDFVCGDGLAALPPGMTFDLIAANPPYIPSSEIILLEPEVRDYDPRVALDGGSDGLEFYRQLASRGAAVLKPEGLIMLEFGDGQHQAVADLFARENWIVERILNDYTQRPRILIARAKA